MRINQLKQYSVGSILLIGASIAVSALSSKPKGTKFENGNIVPSAGVPGSGIQQSCVIGSGDACSYTVTFAHEDNCGIGSRTTEDGITSTFTNISCQNGLKTDTIGNRHSSQSPN